MHKYFNIFSVLLRQFSFDGVCIFFLLAFSFDIKDLEEKKAY